MDNTDSRKKEIKKSLIDSFNKTYKVSMHKLLGEKKSKQLIDEVFEVLWDNKFTDNRSKVQKEIEDTIEAYLKAK
jgi:hypothetical protein